jgi:hypothetical protein
MVTSILASLVRWAKFPNLTPDMNLSEPDLEIPKHNILVQYFGCEVENPEFNSGSLDIQVRYSNS